MIFKIPLYDQIYIQSTHFEKFLNKKMKNDLMFL
jgi:hypothetical protein